MIAESRSWPPQVHIADSMHVGCTFVVVESDACEDARGGRIALSLAALRLLPAALTAAIAAYDRERKAAA